MTPRKMLIVEDEAIVALDMQMHFEAQGFSVVVAATVEAAMASLDHIDLAMLDYHIGADETTPVAIALRERKVPFLVCSGSQLTELGDAFAGVENVGKPYQPAELDRLVDRLLG